MTTLPPTSLVRRWTETPPNRIAVAREEAVRAGGRFIDLITANPHENGLVFPEEALTEAVERAVSVQSVHVYKPDPRGQHPARDAVAGFYRRRSAPADPDHIVLTPGTSLAYFYALRLLTEPGDEILIPAPGYPLFDDIAALCGVRLRAYHLASHSGTWRPDLDDLAFQCTPHTRAVMVISPHNPTGMVFTSGELETLGRVCRERGLALVFDEVFSEFLAPTGTMLPRPNPSAFPLVVTLNGLSKMFSLPGWKIGWMKIDGDPAEVNPFVRALEHLSDTFLPVSEFAQALLPELLRTGDDRVSAALARHYAERRHIVLDSLRCPVYPPDGGVYLCARPPGAQDDEDFCLRALREHGVFIHPGYYYNLPPAHIVMTCVANPEHLRTGIERLNRAFD